VASGVTRASSRWIVLGTSAGLGSVLASAFSLVSVAGVLQACPFCGSVGQPLASRRDAARAVVIAEADGPARPRTDGVADGVMCQSFVVRQLMRGDLPDGIGSLPATVIAEVSSPISGTAAVFFSSLPIGEPGQEGLDAEAIAADEGRLGYLASLPGVERPASERLRWYARRLEHPDPLIAEDAFAEFGQAPFEAVRAAADALPSGELRAWVDDPGILQQRRGFYGLGLGLVAASRPHERAASLAVLHAVVDAPADDFRAGFDGVLAGILVGEGEAGLAFLTARGLLEPTARPVEKRQMLAALRFAWENLAETVPRDLVAAATQRLLESPVTAADATVDLARYGWWHAVDQVAALWQTLGDDDPLVRRAVAGYLTACPTPQARQQIDAILHKDSERFEAAVHAAQMPFAR
jgi:hypothetical protein